jgi:hypothetical protein
MYSLHWVVFTNFPPELHCATLHGGLRACRAIQTNQQLKIDRNQY